MKRSARFDNDDVKKALNEVDTATTRPVSPSPSKAVHFMKNYNNKSVTENGAIAYKTTTHPLLDMNFMVSSFRDWNEEDIVKLFVTAYYEDRVHAVKWLFYLRDVLEGLGERRTFRVCLSYLVHSHQEVALAIMSLIPEYGRYDDLMVYVDSPLCRQVCVFMKRQLNKDIANMKAGLPISLLAKWLPSNNTSSKKARRLARIITKYFSMTEREYRKTLSELRRYLDVVEVKISASEWPEVNYETLPAKANMKYEEAFEKHDEERRQKYLLDAFMGDGKLNVNGLAPHELVHRLMERRNRGFLKDDLLVEALWMHVRDNGFANEWGLEDCIVVADGSGSMYSHVSGSTNIRAIEVCNALAIYFAEQLKGVFHDMAITFSENPQFVDLSKGTSLKERLDIMFSHNEVANTNVEAVFDMLLDMAVSKQVPPEQMPKQVLIISDMEFDEATNKRLYNWIPGKGYDKERSPFTQALFDVIEQRYHEAGYVIPRLIFWNVCGRSNTIPKVEGDSGICLLSGFSQNAIKVAAHREVKDPFECLLKTLDAPRYDKVQRALDELQLPNAQ